MLKSAEQTATVLVIIRVKWADIHTTAPISTSYNQTLTLGGPVKMACFTLGPAAAHPHAAVTARCSSPAAASLHYKEVLSVMLSITATSES